MFKVEDLVARLQNGDTVDDIADEMAKTLNAAKEAYEETEAKRKEEEGKEYTAKRAAIEEILDGLCDYFTATNNDELLDAVHKVDADEVMKLLDSFQVTAQKLKDLNNLEFKYSFNPKDKKIADLLDSMFRLRW